MLKTDRFNKRVEHISKEDNKKLRGQTDEDTQSKSSLIAKFESNTIIKDPREYQLELFERAKVQNTIAVLDTGECPYTISIRSQFTMDRFGKDLDCSLAAQVYPRPRAGTPWAWQAPKDIFFPRRIDSLHTAESPTHAPPGRQRHAGLPAVRRARMQSRPED